MQIFTPLYIGGCNNDKLHAADNGTFACDVNAAKICKGKKLTAKGLQV